MHKRCDQGLQPWSVVGVGSQTYVAYRHVLICWHDALLEALPPTLALPRPSAPVLTWYQNPWSLSGARAVITTPVHDPRRDVTQAELRAAHDDVRAQREAAEAERAALAADAATLAEATLKARAAAARLDEEKRAWAEGEPARRCSKDIAVVTSIGMLGWSSMRAHLHVW